MCLHGSGPLEHPELYLVRPVTLHKPNTIACCSEDNKVANITLVQPHYYCAQIAEQ